MCSVSTTISLTDVQMLYILFPGAKCSDQSIADAKQMFQGSWGFHHSILSYWKNLLSEIIWGIFSDFCQIFHNNINGLKTAVLLKCNAKIKSAKTQVS